MFFLNSDYDIVTAFYQQCTWIYKTLSSSLLFFFFFFFIPFLLRKISEIKFCLIHLFEISCRTTILYNSLLGSSLLGCYYQHYAVSVVNMDINSVKFMQKILLYIMIPKIHLIDLIDCTSLGSEISLFN